MPLEGVDASYNRPDPVRLAAADKHFFVGYVSPESDKNITRSECAKFHAVGVAVCLVWENTGREVLLGHAQGVADGREARRQAAALGFPAGRPIYHAIDFDATPAQMVTIADYFRGVAAAEGSIGLVGVYGGLHQVGYLLDHRLVGYAWQTYAWSDGQWDERAQAQQYHNGVQLAGGTVDLDRAMTDDYGQWEPDMPATDPQMVWDCDTIANPRQRADSPGHVPPPAKPNVTTQADFAIGDMWQLIYDLRDDLAAVKTQIDKLPTTALPPGPMSDADVTRIATAVLDMQAARLAE